MHDGEQVGTDREIPCSSNNAQGTGDRCIPDIDFTEGIIRQSFDELNKNDAEKGILERAASNQNAGPLNHIDEHQERTTDNTMTANDPFDAQYMQDGIVFSTITINMMYHESPVELIFPWNRKLITECPQRYKSVEVAQSH